jgi:hypothetical protein
MQRAAAFTFGEPLERAGVARGDHHAETELASQHRGERAQHVGGPVNHRVRLVEQNRRRPVLAGVADQPRKILRWPDCCLGQSADHGNIGSSLASDQLVG